jgi:hypothetical protein
MATTEECDRLFPPSIALFCLSLRSPFSLGWGIDLRSPWGRDFTDAIAIVAGLGMRSPLLKFAIATHQESATIAPNQPNQRNLKAPRPAIPIALGSGIQPVMSVLGRLDRLGGRAGVG